MSIEPLIVAMIVLLCVVAAAKTRNTETTELEIDMVLLESDRHFEYLMKGDGFDGWRVVAQSSAIGDYEDSFDRPGSSFLWVGDDHHLNREEIAELVDALEKWNWSDNQALEWRCYLPKHGTQNILRQQGDAMLIGTREVSLNKAEVSLLVTYMRTWLKTGCMANI